MAEKQLPLWRTVQHLLRYASPLWRHIVLNFCLGLLSVGLGLLFVWNMKFCIDTATIRSGRSQLLLGLGLLVGITLAQIAIAQLNRWVKALLGVKAQNTMQKHFFAHLLDSQWMAARQYHSGDLLNRLLKDVQSVVHLITEDFPNLLTTILQLIGALCLLCYMDSRLVWMLVLVVPTFVLLSKLFVGKMRTLTHQLRTNESQTQSLLQESMQQLLVVKTLAATASILSRLDGQHRSQAQLTVSKTKYASASALIMSLGFSLGYLLTFSWGVLELQKGFITYGTLTAFLQLVGQIQSPIRSLSQYVPIFINVLTACERLIEVEKIDSESIPSPQSLQEHNTNAASLEGRKAQQFSNTLPISSERISLVLQNLSYRYEADQRWVLRNLNFHFSPGSTTAIMGETGAGKTTLVRLLLALTHPSAGQIYWQSDKQTSHLTTIHRSLFSYTPQGNTLLSGTVRDNLLLAAPQATEAEMRSALQTAQADFVFNSPLGLDSVCTEMGGGFSEGQAQRICIARSLLRPAAVYIFDESTSALDLPTEEKLLQSLVRFGQNKILIFITHRPAVLQYCQQILRLERQN